MAKARVGDDLRLPGEKLGGGSGGCNLATTRRERAFGFVDFAKALLTGLCHLKDIGQEIARLSLRQCETVIEFHEGLRRKSSGGCGIQGYAIRLVLMRFLVPLLPFGGLQQRATVARD